MLFWELSYFFSLLLILLSVMLFTLLERKILSYSQNRLGPNKIFFIGLIQPLLDGVKLMINEKPAIYKNNKFIFFLGPFLVLLVMILLWACLPLLYFSSSIKYPLLFLMVCFGLSAYSSLLSGWASNSKFSSLGAYRGLAQTISYELSLIFSLICLFFMGFILNSKFFNFFILDCLGLSLPIILIWMINILAECGRAPLDFMEGESELVSGFNTEFSSSGFALLFVGEYGLIIFFSLLTVLFFYQGSPINFLFSFLIMLFYLLVRSSYPRFRYDFLMDLAWMKLLPLGIFFSGGIFLFSWSMVFF